MYLNKRQFSIRKALNKAFSSAKLTTEQETHTQYIKKKSYLHRGGSNSGLGGGLSHRRFAFCDGLG
jgi:hypothetical protein